MSSYLSPGDVSERLGIKIDTVYGWLNQGELLGVNVAASRAGRPRWRIAPEALEEFLATRQARPPAKMTRRRKRKLMNVIEFF